MASRRGNLKRALIQRPFMLLNRGIVYCTRSVKRVSALTVRVVCVRIGSVVSGWARGAALSADFIPDVIFSKESNCCVQV